LGYISIIGTSDWSYPLGLLEKKICSLFLGMYIFYKIPIYLESQVHELQTRYEEQHRLIQELQAVKQRLQTESSDQEQQLEESETHLGQIGKLKAQALAQLEEAKRSLEEEHQERMEASAQLKGLEHEIEQIREAIDEEIHNREETLKHLSKAKAETQQWRGRFEGEGLVAADELEEERRRRLNQKLDLSDHLGELNSKLAAVEKTNAKVGEFIY